MKKYYYIYILYAVCILTIILGILYSKHYKSNMPQTIDEIILQGSACKIGGEGGSSDAFVNYLTEAFRARVPIFKKENGTYYTTYDFESNRISGKDTLYVSPDGNDSNSGLTNKFPKRTITSALTSSPNTIVLLEGRYIGGTHFVNDAELSDINLIGVGNVVVDANGAKPLKVVGNFFCKNITFTNGNLGSLHTYITDTISKCTYIECKFNNSLVDNPNIGSAQSLGGLRIQGGTHFIYRCEASHNGFDGFNYHAAPDNPTGSFTSPHIAEVECKGFFNGENNSYESDNGSTAHDGAQVVRLNCEFGYCHGGVIADVHDKTVSYNIGCLSYYSLDLGSSKRNYQASFFCATGATFYMLGCKSHGSYYDISCWNNGKVYTDDLFKNNYSTGGTITKLK